MMPPKPFPIVSKVWKSTKSIENWGDLSIERQSISRLSIKSSFLCTKIARKLFWHIESGFVQLLDILVKQKWNEDLCSILLGQKPNAKKPHKWNKSEISTDVSHFVSNFSLVFKHLCTLQYAEIERVRKQPSSIFSENNRMSIFSSAYQIYSWILKSED